MSKSQATILLEHILRTFPDPIFILDEEDTYVDIAGGTERSLYDSPDYLKTKTLHDIIPSEDADRFLVVVGEALKANSLNLPCANCKKIRDDAGYWKQIECYLGEHSNAQFSHGICPDCARQLYPDIDFDDTEDL